MSRFDTTVVSGTLRRETDRAILLEVDVDEHWLPKSQIDWTEDAEPGEEIDVEVPEWLADERGLG